MGPTYINVFFPVMKVFELVSATLCLDTVKLLTSGQIKSLLGEIAGKTGIKWIEVPDSFTMSRAFKQVELNFLFGRYLALEFYYIKSVYILQTFCAYLCRFYLDYV